MKEVFKVLPARADDEQAYTLYHKAEAAKRLQGKGTTGKVSLAEV